MKLDEALLRIRDGLDEPTDNVVRVGPGYGNAALARIFSRGEDIYYRKEISYDPSRFLEASTLTGTGAVEISQPTDLNRTMAYAMFQDSGRLIQYTEIPYMVSGVSNVATALTNCFYFRDDKIGIIPTVSSGTTVYFDYYRNYTSMSYTEDSDLHPYSIEAAILYACKQAAKFRGDPNWKELEDELVDYENTMLPKINRSSRFATSILPTRTNKRFEIIGTR